MRVSQSHLLGGPGRWEVGSHRRRAAQGGRSLLQHVHRIAEAVTGAVVAVWERLSGMSLTSRFMGGKGR
jgi:hypothetical protein